MRSCSDERVPHGGETGNSGKGRAGRSGSSAASLRTRLASLPYSVRQLVRVVGSLEHTLELVNAFGGVTLHVPTLRCEGGSARHPLRRVLTPGQMRSVMEHYGGTELYIPRCSLALRRVRNAAIIEKFSACAARGEATGPLVRQLALEYGISDRWVWSILKEAQ